MNLCLQMYSLFFLFYLCSHSYKHCMLECSWCCWVAAAGQHSAEICAVRSQTLPGRRRESTDTCCSPEPFLSARRTGWHRAWQQDGSHLLAYRCPPKSSEPVSVSQISDNHNNKQFLRNVSSSTSSIMLPVVRLTSLAFDFVSSKV